MFLLYHFDILVVFAYFVLERIADFFRNPQISSGGFSVVSNRNCAFASCWRTDFLDMFTPISGRFPIWRTYCSIGLKPPTRWDLMEKPTLGQVWVWAKRWAHHFGIAQVVSSYRCLDAKDEHFTGWKGRNMTLFVGCWLLVAGGDWLSGSKIGWSRVWFGWIEFMQQKLASHFTNKNHLPSPAHL